MSGGHFDYSQYHIDQIAESIKSLIYNNKDESVDEWGCTRGHNYPDDIIDHFKEAVFVLQKAYVYAQRIDWLVSGDDGEDSFRERLKEELSKLEKSENDRQAERYRFLRDNGFLNQFWSEQGSEYRCKNIDEDIDNTIKEHESLKGNIDD